MTKDRMEIYRSNENAVPDYGSLFLIKKTNDNVNEYGGTNIEDVVKLELISNAAFGSTCLFTNGDLYRKEFSGWNKMGENPTNNNEEELVEEEPTSDSSTSNP